MSKKRSTWVRPAFTAVVLLVCHRAYADNGAPTVPGSSNEGQPAFHPNLYKFTLQRLEEKPFSGAPRENNGTAIQQNKPAGQVEPNPGLHWTTIDSHPSVGYQIDKNEELRLHFGGHGAKASFALRF